MFKMMLFVEHQPNFKRFLIIVFKNKVMKVGKFSQPSTEQYSKPYIEVCVDSY